MYAGENLCSLKSRNNCIMRRKIFDIYKALRHFNVTAEEANEIAQGYQYWLTNQVESLPPYNTVYFCPLDDKLYSMPYPSGRLEKLFIGIEIDGAVFASNFYDIGCCQNQIENQMQKLKSLIAQKFLAIEHFKLRLPTKDEAKTLIDKMYNDAGLWTAVCLRRCDVWITPNPDHPEMTCATIGANSISSYQPSEDTRALVFLVVVPEKEQIFYGKVDKYGTPTKDTLSIYNQLYDRLF